LQAGQTTFPSIKPKITTGSSLGSPSSQIVTVILDLQNGHIISTSKKSNQPDIINSLL
jgi:hypothetical protein